MITIHREQVPGKDGAGWVNVIAPTPEERARLVHELGAPEEAVVHALDPAERHAGLTVNEYETLLMKHDLAEVLRNPVRFMIEKGKHMWQDPRAIPSKTRNYAKYDLVQVVNELLDTLGVSDSLVETLLAKLIAVLQRLVDRGDTVLVIGGD